jgi:hypothetical protein
MAENESLDLKSPQARRWIAVLDVVRAGASFHEIGMTAMKTLSIVLRKALIQFEGYGVTTNDFLTNRASPKILTALIRQTKGHDYAQLLVDVLNSNPSAPRTDCLHRWVRAIVDAMIDQISHELTGSRQFPSFPSTRLFFGKVRDEIRLDLEQIAIDLARDPNWRPVVRQKRGEPKADATSELLSMSLIG